MKLIFKDGQELVITIHIHMKDIKMGWEMI